MEIVGHRGVLTALASIPQVSLFIGPSSVGKWTVAEEQRRILGVGDSDVLRVQRLYAETAREIVRFASMAPAGESRLVIARLDEASLISLNILLKALEESPTSSRFILISPTYPLPTLVSRSQIFEFGLLSDEEVAEVLVMRKFLPARAQIYAQKAGGRISQAFKALDGSEAKAIALGALRAIRLGDHVGLDKLALKWQEEHTDLLLTWCQEQITQRWRFFTDAEAEETGNKLALKIMMALRADVRPRLVVRASLMSVLRSV